MTLYGCAMVRRQTVKGAATFGYREIHLQFKIYPGKGTIFHFSKLANYNFLAHNEKAKERKEVLSFLLPLLLLGGKQYRAVLVI